MSKENKVNDYNTLQDLVNNVEFSFFKIHFFSHISNIVYEVNKKNIDYVNSLIHSYGAGNIAIIPLDLKETSNNS